MSRIFIFTITISSILIGLCFGAFLAGQKNSPAESVPGVRIVTHQLECYSTPTYMAGNKATNFSPTLVGAISRENDNAAVLGTLWFSPHKNSWAFSITTNTDETCEVVIGNSLQRFPGPTDDIPQWVDEVLRPEPVSAPPEKPQPSA